MNCVLYTNLHICKLNKLFFVCENVLVNKPDLDPDSTVASH